MNRKSKTNKLQIPKKFRSEAEEAAWWDSHQDLIADLVRQANARRAKLPSKSIAIRLPVNDIARARHLAARQGVGYQTLVKMLLHEALEREEAKRVR